MNEHQWLVEQFEANRTHLRAVAYRMLGSLAEADDAVQESWLHLSRSDASGVKNIGGWLTTVVARVCLDMLRSRKSRREESLEANVSEPIEHYEGGVDPEQEALLADSVGLALLVVLDILTPAERLAFVLHDIFAVPFDDIAPIVQRSETATRQLASRARRRVRGAVTEADADLTRSRNVVEAFLAASREGSFATLLTMLAPDVVFRYDSATVSGGDAEEVRGAVSVARLFSGRAQETQPALVNGSVGIVVAPHGRLKLVLSLTMTDGKIAEINVISDSTRLSHLRIAVFAD